MSCVLGIAWATFNFLQVKRINVINNGAESSRQLVNEVTEEQRKLLIELGDKIANVLLLSFRVPSSSSSRNTSSASSLWWSCSLLSPSSRKRNSWLRSRSRSEPWFRSCVGQWGWWLPRKPISGLPIVPVRDWRQLSEWPSGLDALWDSHWSHSDFSVTLTPFSPHPPYPHLQIHQWSRRVRTLQHLWCQL